MSKFNNVLLGPSVYTLELNRAYDEDTFKNKVNLAVGAYRGDTGLPWVLPVVKLAEKAMLNDESLDKEYFPPLGTESFNKAATKLLLGNDSKALKENRVFAVQSLSGTGCLRLGAEFLHSQLKCPVIYYAKQTWGNHALVGKNAGFTEAKEYRYYSESRRSLDIEGMLEDLSNAPENSVILLQAVAHNPTGCDPTKEQWAKIADVMEAKKLFCFFDCVFHGFGSGDMDVDVWPIRYFESRGFEMLVSQAFSKCSGLYNDRIGNLCVVVNDPTVIPMVKSQLTLLIRGMYSNPPGNGARIIERILSNKNLTEEWKRNVKIMADRLIKMRKELRAALERLGAPGNWEHLTAQCGFFSLSGLNEAQSEYMVKKHHVYMLKTGRISIPGLTTQNIEYVAKAMVDSLANA